MRIRTRIEPGDIARVIYLHAVLYAREHSLDRTFEGYVAAGLGDFLKSYDERKDCLWLAESEGKLVGSIAIVGQPNETVQLRWFIVDSEARGGGLGRQLLSEALEFCRSRRFRSVFLWTISELKAAAHLYQEAGFRLTEQKTHIIWGGPHTEERYDLILRAE